MRIKSIVKRVKNSNVKDSLSFKLGLVFVGVAVMLIIISLMAVFFIIKKERGRYAERESENVLSTLSTGIESDIDYYRGLSRLIMTEQKVRNFLRTSSDEIDQPMKVSTKLAILDYLNVTSGVDSVFVFRNDLDYVSTINRLDYRMDGGRMEQEDWLKNILALKGMASLSLNGNGAIFKSNDATTLTINRAIYDNVSQKQTGVLFMNLSTSFLKNEIRQIQNENVCILTTDGTFLAGNGELEEYYTKEFATTSIFSKSVSDKNGGMTLSGKKIKGLSIVILYAIRDEKRILPVELLYVIIILPIIYFLCVFVAGTFIRRNITRPIFALTSEMEKNREKERIEKLDVDLPPNEIGMLKDSYNNMVDHINRLLERLIENEQTIQKAEMRVLQEQIKPHFLYNSLETIGYLAVDSGAEKVHSALETLGSFYRNFLSKGDREIPLKREIMIIKDYLSLQKLRYGDIINDEYDIAENTEECIIPKLILQPLVENSIYHGIRMKGEPGTIRISSFLKDDGLHIVVRDTGIGMTEEQIENVLTKEKGEPSGMAGGSFGLWGTIERIRCYCDSNDVVSIRSELGEYTEIEFTFLKQERNKYVQSYVNR